MFLVGQTLAGSWQSYGVFILETVAVLAVIALAAWGIARFGGHRLGKRAGGIRPHPVLFAGPLEVFHIAVFNCTDASKGSYTDTVVFENRAGNRNRPTSKTEAAVTIRKQAIGNGNPG